MNLGSTKFVSSVIEEGVTFDVTLPCFRVGNLLNIKSGTAAENRSMKTLQELLLEERNTARWTDPAKDAAYCPVNRVVLSPVGENIKKEQRIEPV